MNHLKRSETQIPGRCEALIKIPLPIHWHLDFLTILRLRLPLLRGPQILRLLGFNNFVNNLGLRFVYIIDLLLSLVCVTPLLRGPCVFREFGFDTFSNVYCCTSGNSNMIKNLKTRQ